MKISVVLLVATSCALVTAKLFFNKLQSLASNSSQPSSVYPTQEYEKLTVDETYPETQSPTQKPPTHRSEDYLVSNMDDDSCLQLRAVQYHIPNDHIIPLVLRIVFNELGRPEPPQLVHLINSKVLRQVQLDPRNIAPIFRELRFHLKESLDTLPLPNGFKNLLLGNLEKYFKLLPKIKLGTRQLPELYCHAKILAAILEVYKGSPLDPDTVQKFYDATILLTRLTSEPNSNLTTVVQSLHQQPSDEVYNVLLDVESNDNVQPAQSAIFGYTEERRYSGPEESYNTRYQPAEEYELQSTVDIIYDSVDINLENEKYGHQPGVSVQQPEHNFPNVSEYNISVDIDVEQEKFEHQLKVEMHQPIEKKVLQPTYLPEYNISLDINVEQEEFEHQPKVEMHQSVEEKVSQPTYLPEYNISLDINVEQEEFEHQPEVEMHQSVEEKVSQPTYLPEHNISLDINVEQEEFEHQPKVQMHQSVEEKVSQPTYLPEYNISLDINVEQEEFEHQPKVEMHQSVEEKVSQPTYLPEYNISLDINVEQEEFEHQPKVQIHQSVEEKVSQPTYLPEYNISLDINVEQEEFEHQPKVEMHQSVEEKVSQPTYLPEHNISLDINVEQEKFEHQPKVEMHQSVEEKVSQPTYLPEHNISLDINVEQEEFEHQPKVEMHQSVEEKVSQPTYPPKYNISLDINVEQEEFEHQPEVEMHQSVEEKVSQPTYLPEYNISLDINVEQEKFEHQPKVEMHQSVEEKVSQPTYLPEYNISLDINVEREEFEHQPKVEMHQPVEKKAAQPTYKQQAYVKRVQQTTESFHEQPEYNISVNFNVEHKEYEHQSSVRRPVYQQSTIEHTPTVFHQPSYQPIESEYDTSMKISIEKEEYSKYNASLEPLEYEHQPETKVYKSYQPSGSEYDVSVDKKAELEHQHQPMVDHAAYLPVGSTNNATLHIDIEQEERKPDHVVEVKYPPHQAGSLVEHVWQNQSKQVAEVVGGYNPRDLKDFVPAYGDDLDVQTPAYIPRFVSIAESVIPFQATLQRFLTGNKQLVSLPKVIKTVGALHRIKIDVKISIEKIVGTLIGYNPGLNDIVRQVYNLFCPILPHIPVGDLSGPHDNSAVRSVSQNTAKVISEVVKLILDALSNSHPSIQRVYRAVLPKLFRTVFHPSSAPPQSIVSLVKLLEPVWDKLPHRQALSPPKLLVSHFHEVTKMVKQLVVVNKDFPQLLNNVSRASPLDGVIRKIYHLLKRDGDCLNRETVVQVSREILNLKLAFPQIPSSALKTLQIQSQELIITLKTSCSNALIHRYVKEFELSLFSHWGIQKKEQLPDNLFVHPIMKSVHLHDLEQGLWGNLGDYLAALVGSSAPVSLPARFAKLSLLLKRFYKRTVINVPNDYEVNNVALRISNLLAGAFSISHNVIYHLKSSVVSGLQLIRDVIHGRREAHNLESIINGVSVKIGVVLQKSQILLKNSHSLVRKLQGNLISSINQFTKKIVEYRSVIKKYVAKIKLHQKVTEHASRPLEQLLYRLPPIVKEMTKCSDILPYKSYEYFNQLLSTFSGKAIPTDLSYRLVNLVRQVRNQRCADHVSLPGSLGHLKTYFPGKSFKKYHVKFALRKVFTQVAFANSVNVRLNSHLRYTVQHLLGVIQPHVLTNQQTAGDFVSSVREWASSLVHTINQPHQRHLIKRSVMKLSATFTAVLRPQQKQPPKEFTNKLLDLSNSILAWYQSPSPQPLRHHTHVHIQAVVQVLKSINSEVDTSQLQHILPLLVTHLQGYAVNKDDTLDNPSVHITSTILDLLGKEHVPEQKQLLAQRTKSILALLRNKSACLSRYSSDNAQHEIKGYINFLQSVLRINLGSETEYLLQHLLEKTALAVTNTAMQPSIHAVPTRYEHLRPGYVDTCSASSRVLSIIPTGEHSLGKLWNLNLITALDTVKKGVLLFLDDFSGHELARNAKEVVDIVLSTVTNHAISHSDKLSFSIKLALRINKGVVIPGNRNTLKSVREINDLTDFLSGIRHAYVHEKHSQNVRPIIKSLVDKVSELYGSAPSAQFAQSFHQLIEHLISRNSQNVQEVLQLLHRTTQSAQNNWGHVVVPAKRISLNLALRNLLVNIVVRISNSAEPISTWQPVFESFHGVAKVIAPNSNPSIIVDLLKRVVHPIQNSYQCSSSSYVSISKDISTLVKHIGDVAYKGEGGHDHQQFTVFDHLLNNVREIACVKAKPHDKPDYMVLDYNKYLHSLGLPEFFAKNQIQRLFSIMIHNLPSGRQVFRANIRSVVPTLVHHVFSSLGIPVHVVKKQRLMALKENLLVVIKHNVFQEKQIQNIVKIINSLLWHPNNDHLHFGLNNAFYQLLRTVTEDNSYNKHPKVTELLRHIRVGLILSAVNRVPLNPTQTLISSRLQVEHHPSLLKALHDLGRSLQNRQSHQPNGPLFDSLLNLVHEIKKVLVPTKQVQSVQQAKRVVVDYVTQIMQSYVPPQLHDAVAMKIIGAIDEFINKLQTHFGIIIPKPVRRAPPVSGVPEAAILSNLSPAVLLAEFKGPLDRKFA